MNTYEINLFDSLIDFVVLEDKKIIDRWFYSGHKEHIMHLMQKVDEHQIVLTDEHKILIKQVQDSFIYPTVEEIAKEEIKNKIAEALAYLNKTDKKFFIGYKPKPDEDLVLIEKLRDEARDFIRANS